MNIKPETFLQMLHSGISENILNIVENPKSIEALRAEGKGSAKNVTLQYLVKKCGHTEDSAFEHLNTDYSDGYTICGKCGSFYHLGKGFTKHLSNGCLHCEGQQEHNVYWHNGTKGRGYNFPARWMSVMFDDKMHYCKDKLEVEKYKDLI